MNKLTDYISPQAWYERLQQNATRSNLLLATAGGLCVLGAGVAYSKSATQPFRVRAAFRSCDDPNSETALK